MAPMVPRTLAATGTFMVQSIQPSDVSPMRANGEAALSMRAVEDFNYIPPAVSIRLAVLATEISRVSP